MHAEFIVLSSESTFSEIMTGWETGGLGTVAPEAEAFYKHQYINIKCNIIAYLQQIPWRFNQTVRLPIFRPTERGTWQNPGGSEEQGARGPAMKWFKMHLIG